MRLVKVFDKFPKDIRYHFREVYWYEAGGGMFKHTVSLEPIDVSEMMLEVDKKDRQESWIALNEWLINKGAFEGETVIIESTW